MSRERKEFVEEEAEGAPEWMVTFSDCMTLLLTFFVLLLSFSSFSDVSEYKALTVSFASQFASVSDSTETKNAMLPNILDLHSQKEIDQGSEIRSDQDSQSKEGGQKSSQTPDSQNNIFIAPSQKIFWGKGTILSRHGRNALSDMAMFLKAVPNRVVISECDMGSLSSDEVGLQRAWSVMTHLSKSGINTDRLNISSASTIMGEGDTLGVKERHLQIVLLERNVYR